MPHESDRAQHPIKERDRSQVLDPVPPYATVAGVPARVVRTGGPHVPARAVTEIIGDLSYETFAWSI